MLGTLPAQLMLDEMVMEEWQALLFRMGTLRAHRFCLTDGDGCCSASRHSEPTGSWADWAAWLRWAEWAAPGGLGWLAGLAGPGGLAWVGAGMILLNFQMFGAPMA